MLLEGCVLGVEGIRLVDFEGLDPERDAGVWILSRWDCLSLYCDTHYEHDII